MTGRPFTAAVCEAAHAALGAWAGLATVTQDTEDVLSTDLGRAVTASSATLRRAEHGRWRESSTWC